MGGLVRWFFSWLTPSAGRRRGVRSRVRPVERRSSEGNHLHPRRTFRPFSLYKGFKTKLDHNHATVAGISGSPGRGSWTINMFFSHGGSCLRAVHQRKKCLEQCLCRVQTDVVFVKSGLGAHTIYEPSLYQIIIPRTLTPM
ncbi:hypothetical protein C7M84_006845 [Penaeus vannamei]|uniref:Uncharacterized protein n=1 Tax=Penaeus vannamei TaxID=6689 RepID=A0A3R7P3S0_PENVA|nr:hypothetical protein C7M84_006845 [Penaeus vannamei]